MKDLSFLSKGSRFNFRVAGYITCGDKMLLQGAKGVDFFNLVGGRVQFNESTKIAFAREIKEELDIDVKNPKLFMICENFFNWQNHDVHELLFIYRIELPKSYLSRLDHFNILDKAEFTVWVDKAEVKTMHCLPNIVCNLPDCEKMRKPIVKVIG